MLQTSHNTEALPVLSHLVKAGMLYQVSCKEHTGLYAHFLNMLNHLIAVCAFLTGDEEAKPAGSCVLAGLRKNQLVLRACQSSL